MPNIRNYESISTNPEPIWTQVIGNPENRLQYGTTDSESEGKLTKRERGGLNVITAAIFIAGEMAGSGVLALPKAIVNTGWMGLILLVVFCINAGVSGSKLGKCWQILEERYPEYRAKSRSPYGTIAEKAVGIWGRYIVSGCIQITLFGAGTVYLLLASQIMQELVAHIFPAMSFCYWFLLLAAALMLPMWLESPKDFRAVGIIAIVTTAIACILFFIQTVKDGVAKIDPVKHVIHGFPDFFLAFGVLLFAFGGASTFPTIQNDMVDKRKFSLSVTIAFGVVIALYLPVTAAGYYVYGEDIQANIAMSITKSPLLTIANVCMMIHLIFAFLIVINPVCQELEEILSIPRSFSWKRCLLRFLILVIMVFIGESIPRFGKILSLVGGSTITLLTFVFPPYFYMKLCSQKNDIWPERHVPLYMKIYLWELILIGIIGGSCSTYTAIHDIFSPGSLVKPCYWPNNSE